MSHVSELRSLSDDELLRRLSEILQQSRRAEADLVAHIGEVDERRLYAGQACSSMFVYCTEVLHFSEAEAYFRIAVARAARKHPMLLEMLRQGRLHLSGIAILAPHLTEENSERVLARAACKSKRQIEELVAELSPKPDAPALIRKLPTPPTTPSVQLFPERVEPSATPEPETSMRLRRPERQALQGAPGARVPPPRPLWPWRGPRPRHHQSQVPDSQRLSRRAGVRKRGDRQTSTAGRPCFRAPRLPTSRLPRPQSFERRASLCGGVHPREDCILPPEALAERPAPDSS
jgi:hypothetical protein